MLSVRYLFQKAAVRFAELSSNSIALDTFFTFKGSLSFILKLLVFIDKYMACWFLFSNSLCLMSVLSFLAVFVLLLPTRTIPPKKLDSPAPSPFFISNSIFSGNHICSLG